MNASTISNGIQKRQNEKENLEKLAAADWLYSEVKRLELWKFSLTVALPFLLSCVQPFFKNRGALLEVLPYVLSIMSMTLSFLLNPSIRKKVGLAADIKQDYDVSVYQMPWSREFFGKRRNLTKEIAENSMEERRRGKESDRFRDWYRPEADALPLQDGIFACQRENYAWDSGLRGRYRKLCLWGIGALIALVFLVGILNNEAVTVLLWRLAFVVPILSWLLETVSALNADLERLEEMRAAFQSADTRNMEDLQEIQKALYEHRKDAAIPPGFLYRWFKDSDEETARHTMEIESWGKR